MPVVAAAQKNPNETSVTVRGSYAITPSDTDQVATMTKFLLVDVAGAVKVTLEDGTTDTITLIAGVWHKISVKQVWFTGTTATGIHGGH